MSRSLPLWIGASDDTAIPRRVKLRVWSRCDGRCHRCNRRIPIGDAYIYEHLVALVLGGRNAEDNLVLSCSWCKPLKDAEDVAAKSKTAAVRAKHLLPRAPSRLHSAGFRKSEPQRTASGPIRRKPDRMDTGER